MRDADGRFRTRAKTDPHQLPGSDPAAHRHGLNTQDTRRVVDAMEKETIILARRVHKSSLS